MVLVQDEVAEAHQRATTTREVEKAVEDAAAIAADDAQDVDL